MDFPKQLVEITEYLEYSFLSKQLKLQKVLKKEDGRVKSAGDQQKIVDHLRAHFPYLSPKDKPRFWYDFGFTCSESKKFIPVNIKIGNISTPGYNSNCRLGTYYAVTGIDPISSNKDLHNEVANEDYVSRLIDNVDVINSKGCDYYFIGIHRETGAVTLTSLKTLPSENITLNTANLPFQITLIHKVKKQRGKDRTIISPVPVWRSNEESVEFLIEMTKKAWFHKLQSVRIICAKYNRLSDKVKEIVQTVSAE